MESSPLSALPGEGSSLKRNLHFMMISGRLSLLRGLGRPPAGLTQSIFPIEWEVKKATDFNILRIKLNSLFYKFHEHIRQ